MSTDFTDLQLDALREVANIGSGNAATALAQMLGREVELAVPRALALPLADAVDAVGPADASRSAVVLPIFGDLDAIVLLLFSDADAATLCSLLGVEAGTEWGDSALGEIGNILGTSYINALASLAGVSIEPRPPHVVTDMLGAIVASLLTETAGETDIALVLDSELDVQGVACSMSFLLLPTAGGVTELLARLGMG
ncbi:MAG: CheC, inhibitor of methylation [Conexibacter sp.]|nr:CheC, inhibitor of methylation [Conexibacter sp.]